MPIIEPDTRSPERKALDEAIANEPHEPVPVIPPGTPLRPMEAFLPQRKPVAVAGIVENGLVRPLDPAVRLAERQRVITVAADPSS
jgi:hypothetical protein